MISVIIPVFNCEKYIAKSVSSVFEQDYRDIELIVVDDGSTDSTPQRLSELQEKYSERRFYIISTANNGVSAARNVGLSQAKGEYVTFLDADDWLDKGAISFIYNLVQKYPNKLVSTNLAFVNENEASQEKDILSQTDAIFPVILEKKEALYLIKDEKFHLQTACSKLFRVNLLRSREILFDEDIAFGEDGLFVFRYLLEVEGVVFFDACVYNVLARAESATRVSFNPKWLDMSSIDRMMGLTEDAELISTLKNLRISRLYSDIRRYYKDDVSDKFFPEVKMCLKVNMRNMLFSSRPFKSKILWVGMLFLPRRIISNIVRKND